MTDHRAGPSLGVGDRLLSRSDRYCVIGSYETAILVADATVTCVGDHYGDVRAAAIDPDERWVVTVGCGLIVYRLGAPWDDYLIDVEHDRWWEWGNRSADDGAVRRPHGTVWLDRVRHTGGATFECAGHTGDWVLVDAEAQTATRRYGLAPDW